MRILKSDLFHLGGLIIIWFLFFSPAIVGSDRLLRIYEVNPCDLYRRSRYYHAELIGDLGEPSKSLKMFKIKNHKDFYLNDVDPVPDACRVDDKDALIEAIIEEEKVAIKSNKWTYDWNKWLSAKLGSSLYGSLKESLSGMYNMLLPLLMYYVISIVSNINKKNKGNDINPPLIFIYILTKILLQVKLGIFSNVFSLSFFNSLLYDVWAYYLFYNIILKYIFKIETVSDFKSSVKPVVAAIKDKTPEVVTVS